MIVVIPTKNESKHILRAISSARNLSNIIMIYSEESIFFAMMRMKL